MAMLNNTWSSADHRDAHIALHDHPNMDTRSFSRLTKSQLSSSKAIDKTLQHAHNHRSECLPYSKSMKNQQTLGFNQIKKIKDETSLSAQNVLTMKFWSSFQKHAVSINGDESSSSSISSAGMVSVPVPELQRAMRSMTDRSVEVEVRDIVQALGFRPTESLSWKEYKGFCNRIFDPASALNSSPHNQSQSIMNDTISQSLESYQSLSLDGNSRSPSFQSTDTSQDVLQCGKSQSYTHLQRKHRGVNSIRPNKDHLDITDFSPAESTILAPVKKDALCEVLKNEYRKIRKNKIPDADKRLQDSEKGYLKQTQGQKIAAIRDKRNLVPLKWKSVNEKRAAREAITQNYNNRKNMIQSLKTVVNAQERNSTNRDVLNKDEEAMSNIEDNSMKRYIENEITTRNIKSWKANERKIRSELRAEYKKKMALSVSTSRQMIEEEKEFRKFMLSSGTDAEAHTLSQCTSSKFEVPADIANRISTAKKLSTFELAKEEALVAYEKEMSRRIGLYQATRQQAIKQAEDFGCGISLNPMRGEDYFQDEGAARPHSQPSAVEKYFDSASTVTFPDNKTGGSYDSSCPPVYLDPNYDSTAIHKSMSSHLYDNAASTRTGANGNTKVADTIHKYDDDCFGDSVAGADVGAKTSKEAEDDLSITDSIDSHRSSELEL